MNRSFVCLLGAVLCLLEVGAARADGIASAPCSDGAQSMHWGHGPSYCAPAPCTTDAECAPQPGGGARHCLETAICVVHEEAIRPPGHTPLAGLTPEPRDRVTGPCAADGTCAEGQCVRGRHCATRVDSAPPLPSAASGCGCSGAGAGGGLLAGVSVFVLAAWTARRSRVKTRPPS